MYNVQVTILLKSVNRRFKVFIITLFVLSAGIAILNSPEEQISTLASQSLSMAEIAGENGIVSIKFHNRVEIPTQQGISVGNIKALDLRQRSMTIEHLLAPFLKEQGMKVPNDLVFEEIESVDFSVTVLSASNQQLALPKDADKIDTLEEFHIEELSNIPIEAIEIYIEKSPSQKSKLKINSEYISSRKLVQFEAYKKTHFFVLQSIIFQPNSHNVTLKLVRVYCPERFRLQRSFSASS